MARRTHHDALFKSVFSQIDQARAHLEWALTPEVRAQLDLSTLTLRSGSYVDTALRQSHSDLLFEVQATWSEPVLIYVLYEHRSTPEPLMALRAHRYGSRIMDRWSADAPGEVPPPVLMLVLYHGPTPWRAARRLTELQGVPTGLALPGVECTYHLVELTGDSSQWGRALGILALLLLKFAHTRDLWSRLMGRVDLLKRAVRESGARAFEILLSYIDWVDRDAPPDAELRHLVEQLEDEPTEDVVMRWSEQLRQKGLEDGRREGLRDGLRDGRREGLRDGRQAALRDVLLRLLSARFSPLPASVRDAVREADLDQLERWTERVLTADRPEDVIADDA